MSKAAPGSGRNGGGGRLGAEHQLAEGQAEQRQNLLARPIVPDIAVYVVGGHATSPDGRLSLAFARARGNATSPPRQAEASTLPSLDRFAAEKLASLEARQLRRRLAETTREDGITVIRNGKRLLSFSCNDYLNLSQHPEVKEAAIEAIRRFGVGAGASRLITGNHPLYAELESRLAAAQGHGGGLRLRLGLSRQCRHHPGAHRRGRSRAAG